LLIVDPLACTRYDRTPRELAAFLLFAVSVQGKNAVVQARKIDELFRLLPDREPRVLRYLAHWGARSYLEQVKLGYYGRLCGVIEDLMHTDLGTVSLDRLEACKGIKQKTSRFFLLHSRPGVRYSPLDVHILSYLRDHGVLGVPASTPGNPEAYARLERLALAQLEAEFPHMTLAQADLHVWTIYSGRRSNAERTAGAQPGRGTRRAAKQPQGVLVP
jgi:hypothetical protein